ncbi:MAG: hypothetical protein NPIRA03_01080 [Nitrospirales bacterium]|nr:MAG: hypothetical protein NPIRA03_01080 [Nitrospirales bacterium]
MREKVIGSVPNPRQARSARTDNTHGTPMDKIQPRIVSVGNADIANGKGGDVCPHSLDIFEGEETVNGGIFAMGFTTRVFFLESPNTTT